MARRSWALLAGAMTVAGCTTEPAAAPRRVEFARGDVTFAALGDSAMVAATVLDDAGNAMRVPVAWTVTPSGIVTISVSGDTCRLGAIANGQATLTATAGPASGSLAVHVAQIPVEVVSLSGALTGTVGQAVPQPLVLEVRDRRGRPVVGEPISLAVVAGGGSIAPASAVTDTSGRVAATWTLGTTAGDHGLRAGVRLLYAFFQATATAGPPARLVAGDQWSLRAQASRRMPGAVSARVLDQYGNDVPGQAVGFGVTAGSGTVSPAIAVTGADGIARTSWTVGPELGVQATRATMAAVPGAAVDITTTVVPVTPYFLDVRLLTTPPAGMEDALLWAAARWEQGLVADLADVDFGVQPAPAGTCGTASPAMTELVDDLVVFVSTVQGDGLGRLRAAAGPCFVRATGLLPVVGAIEWDRDDWPDLLSFGAARAHALHELGHVLGFGTMWTLPAFDCLRDPSSPGSVRATSFRCPAAVAAYSGIRGQLETAVPVENCELFWSPSDCWMTYSENRHWRVYTFGGEVMTGWLGPQSANALSRVTLASLADLGYTVDLAVGDSVPTRVAPTLAVGTLVADAPLRRPPALVPVTPHGRGAVGRQGRDRVRQDR